LIIFSKSDFNKSILVSIFFFLTISVSKSNFWKIDCIKNANRTSLDLLKKFSSFTMTGIPIDLSFFYNAQSPSNSATQPEAG